MHVDSTMLNLQTNKVWFLMLFSLLPAHEQTDIQINLPIQLCQPQKGAVSGHRGHTPFPTKDVENFTLQVQGLDQASI